MKSKKKKGAYSNFDTKGHFARKCHKKKKDWKNKFKGSSQVATTKKIELHMIIWSIFAIFRGAWFVDFETSQHLTF
jgi:hypothetical protein